MTLHNSNNTESPGPADAPSSAAFDIEALSPRQQRVVLVCDVVESVRWMEHDEDNAITRWSQFAAAVRSSIAPAHCGEVIKSTGDGLMMEFQAAPGAVAAANAMQKIASEGNEGYTPERQMHLRIGIHQTQARRDAHDLYGHGVNLAARITTLAGPGEIIVTPEVRDHLTDSLDGQIEDMGECYLKHLSEPQRVFRVLANEVNFVAPKDSLVATTDSIAVLSLKCLQSNYAHSVVGELYSDFLSSLLSKNKELTVIARTSTASIESRDLSLSEMAALLKSRYLVTGKYFESGGKNSIVLELVDSKENRLLWSDAFQLTEQELCSTTSETIQRCASDITTVLTNTALAELHTYALPTLQSNSLLLGAVHLMHRTSEFDLQKSWRILDELTKRHTRSPRANAWLSCWYALRITQGQSHNPDADANLAFALSDRSLQHNPNSSLALTMQGVLSMHLRSDIDAAKLLFEAAVQANPSESLAWLYKSSMHSFLGESEQAIESIGHAFSTSPIGPLKAYYENFASAAYLSGGHYGRAVKLAKQSIAGNRTHPATYRMLAIASTLAGDVQTAKKAVQDFLVLVPNYTISFFDQRSPWSYGPLGQIFRAALLEAGVPK